MRYLSKEIIIFSATKLIAKRLLCKLAQNRLRGRRIITTCQNNRETNLSRKIIFCAGNHESNWFISCSVFQAHQEDGYGVFVSPEESDQGIPDGHQLDVQGAQVRPADVVEVVHHDHIASSAGKVVNHSRRGQEAAQFC